MATEKHLDNTQLLFAGLLAPLWNPSLVACTWPWWRRLGIELAVWQWFTQVLWSHMCSRSCQEKGCLDEPKCKFLRRGKVKVSLFTLCRAPRKWHRVLLLDPSCYGSIILHLITSLPPNSWLLWPEAEATHSQKGSWYLKYYKLAASEPLKYNLLGNWCRVEVERWKRVFLAIFQSFPGPWALW